MVEKGCGLVMHQLARAQRITVQSSLYGRVSDDSNAYEVLIGRSGINREIITLLS